MDSTGNISISYLPLKQGMPDRYSPFAVLLAACMILVVFGHIVKQLTGLEGIPYYISYFCWLLLFIYSWKYEQLHTTCLVVLLVALFLLSSALSVFSIEVAFGVETIAWQRVLMFALAVYVSFSLKSELSFNDIKLLMALLIIMGVIASMYAMIVQADALSGILTGADLKINSWRYRSFFGQRNIFAEFLLLCIICAFYLFYRTKACKYLFACALFAFQVICTNSRASILATAFLFAFGLIVCCKRKYVAIGIILISLIAIFISGFSDYLVQMINHFESSQDSGNDRIEMWIAGLDLLWKDGNWIFGLGAGSSQYITMPIGGVASFHNAYIEVFFEGGVVKLAIIVGAISFSLKSILEQKDRAYAKVWMVGLAAFVFHSFFESGMILFASNYFSVITTILFVIVPRVYGERNCEKAVVHNENFSINRIGYCGCVN